MTIRKYASVDLRDHKPQFLAAPSRSEREMTARFGSFSFRPRPGYVYSRVRAISARINKNFDGFPSEELEKAAHTFHGRPVFINHNNSDPERTRGVILASQYHGDDPEDKYITILPEVDALTFPDLAKDLVDGNMDSVSMGCDVDNSTCSYCGNVATTAEEFCDHILNNKGQELTKLVNGRPQKILVYEICRGLNFFEISFVFDPADETAVMQEVIVPDGARMASADWARMASVFPARPHTQSGSGMQHLAYGEMIAPPKVDTLRDDDDCPQCGNEFNGVECENCGYVTPPEELQDPDTSEAGDIRDDDDDQDGDHDDLDYFGDDDDEDSDEDDDDEDEPDDEEDENAGFRDMGDMFGNGQPRKEGNVSRGNAVPAVQANVGQALAQRRLAEAQRRLRVMADEQNDAAIDSDPTPAGDYPVYGLGSNPEDGSGIAPPPPAAEAPVNGGAEAEGAPDMATTVEALDDTAAPGDYGTREPVQQVMTSSVRARQRRTAEDLDNSAQAQPDDRDDVTAPVAGMLDGKDGQDGQDSQYTTDGWDNNADDNSAFSNEHVDETSTVVPDGTGRTPMQAGSSTKTSAVLKRASASQVYQLADLYTDLGLVPREQRYAAIAEIEKMPAIVASHTIKVLNRVAQVLGSQIMPKGRVARTGSTIPQLGKTAGRAPSMARAAEDRRLASSAEDTLLFIR